MDLESLAQVIQSQYELMAQRFAEAQKATGLSCPSGCGQCCSVPTIEASVLEMLPMAMELYRQGRALEMYEDLKREAPLTCVMYQATSADKKSGQCLMYQQRPSVCRMFGVASRSGKNPGERQLSICQTLKTLHPAWPKIDPFDLPLMSEAYSQLAQLHPEFTQDRGPISLTLSKALEKVLLYQGLKNS
jgi:Fe-S-cluster containining protein